MAEDYKLIDNEEKHRYEFQIDDKIAEIDYIKSNNGEIYLVHTEVPASLGVNPEKPDVPLNKNDAFQKVQKRRVQEKR